LTARHHLDAAVGEVDGVAVEAQVARDLLRRAAEPHALHPPGDQEACRAHRAARPAFAAAAMARPSSSAVTGPMKESASRPSGATRWVAGRPRGVAKAPGGAYTSTIARG